MVFVMIRLLYVEPRIMGGNLYQFPIQIFPEFCGYDGVTVFGRKDYVVITEVYAVTCSSILVWLIHALSLSQRRRPGAETRFIPRAYARRNFRGLKKYFSVARV